MKITTKLILGLFLVSSVLSSCTKDFEELNTSPNSPVDVPAINVFTNAVQSTVALEMGDWIQHTYLGVWSQQWCKVQYIDEDRYMPRDMSTYFNSPYTGALKDLTIVMQKAEEDEDNLLLGAAKVMTVQNFMYLTDLFGDIPYTEALSGLDKDAILQPSYDKQADVYAALLNTLEEANQLLASSSLNFGSGDILYGGDPVLWRKYANSLKLRLLNRAAGTPWSFTYNMAGTQADVTTTPGAAALSDADTRITAILSNPSQYPVFTSNDDNAALVYPGEPYRNPIFNTLYARTDQAISETMVNWLEARTDPRIHIYGQPTPESVEANALDYVGFQNGREITSAPFPKISLLGTAIAYNENAPLFVMSYDEVEFIKAEHFKRIANDANAQTAYETAIKASMERWGLTNGGTVNASWGKADITVGPAFPVNFATYLANPLVAWGGTDAEKFQKIAEQKWASMYGQGVQAFSEVRRTGFPARIFEYELAGAYYPNMGLPVRLQYALSEDTYNTDQLALAKSSQGVEVAHEGMFSTNGITSQLWWHTRKNPIPTETDVR